MKIPEIIAKIESECKIEILKNGKVSYKPSRRFVMIKTSAGTREFKSADMVKGARLLIQILTETSKDMDATLHGRKSVYEPYPDVTQSGSTIPLKRKK